MLRHRFSLAALALLGGLALTACSSTNLQGALNTVNGGQGLNIVRDLSFGEHPRQRLDVYAPQGVRDAPVVLFVHGGSWQGQDKSGHAFVGDSLARAGYVVGVANYRLAPEFRYPAYVQDAGAALRLLRDRAREFGGDPDRLFLMGHSAGAFNVIELAVSRPWLEQAGVPVGALRGVIGIAGPYDYDFRDFESRVAFPEAALPAEVMPTRAVREGAPPHLLITAGRDTVVHPQNADRMEAALRAAGVPVERHEVPRADHVTVLGAVARALPFLGDTRSRVIAFIEARRGR